MSATAPVRPLVARVEPIAGESLLSLVARSAHANVFPSVSDLLHHAGLTRHPAFLPFGADVAQAAEALGALLGVEPGEVLQRLHPPVKDGRGREEIAWAGGRLERRFVEARLRRVSPASLASSAHHRLVWTNRAVGFCPESFQQLICACPACARPLGWTHTQGLDRCEQCRASLLEGEAPFVAEALRPRLTAAAGLVDADPRRRSQALGALPAAFQAFDPGEAFTAVVELGVAWTHPEAGRGSPVCRQLVTGRFAVPPEALAAGYELAQSWPDGYGELVGRIWRSQRACDGIEPSMALRRLGGLGRWFDHRLCDHPFAQLLARDIERAAELGAMPRKRPGRAPAGADAEVLTLTEASELFGVSKATLGRLVPEGACVLSGKLGRGGAVRIRAAGLRASVREFRRALSAVEVGAALGAPAYVLPAFVEAGLLARVDDADACRLAGGDLYTRESVEDLLFRLHVRADAADELTEPLAPSMRRLFRPQDWIAAFKALLDGELRLGQPIDRSGTSLLAELTVEQEAGRALLIPLRGQPPAQEAWLSAADVGLLLGMSPIYVAELIQEDLLPARREGRSWRITLSEVTAFDRAYVLSLELAETCFFTAGPAWNRLLEDPVARTRHLTLYARDEVYPPASSS